MARFNIAQYWSNLRANDPAEYRRRINERNRKAGQTRHQRYIEEHPPKPKNPNRVAAAKRVWRARFDRETERMRAENLKREEAVREADRYLREQARQKYEFRLNKILSIDPTQIPKLTNDELKSLIDEAKSAIEYRENEFMQHYTGLTGSEEFDFKREKFDYTDEDSMGKLRHILRMEQKYLERKNSWEEYSAQMENFMNRVSQKGMGREMSLTEKINFRKRFFQLYTKAKQMYNAGADESKGSPLFTQVAEIMESNPEISLEEFIERMEQNYAELQEEEERRLRDEGGATTADFFGLSDDDLI